MYFGFQHPTIIAVCVCRPVSAADLDPSEAVEAPGDSPADAPAAARPEVGSAGAEPPRSVAVVLAPNAVGVDDSSPAVGLAAEDSAAAGSSQVAAAADCWDSDTRCAAAEPCDSYPGDSSRDGC